MRSSSAGISVAVHLGAVALMSLLGARFASQHSLSKPHITVPLIYRPASPDRGGGGAGDPLPPSKGALPPPADRRIFVAPMVTATTPKLPVAAALLDAPQLEISATEYGDPLARAGIPSGGRGGRGGIGDGYDRGVGNQRGPRFGGGDTPPVAVIEAVRYSTPPRLVYKVEPEYPDEARKARFQGVVVLRVEVDTAGRPHRIQLVQGLGLGTDERAQEAVSKWRFTPAMDRGRPVTAPVIVEVAFRLL